MTKKCGPEIEKMAEDLKAHGDEFIDALSGNGSYRNGGGYHRGGMNGGGSYRNGGRAWHRNEGTWEEREELRKQNEQKLHEMDISTLL